MNSHESNESDIWETKRGEHAIKKGVEDAELRPYNIVDVVTMPPRCISIWYVNKCLAGHISIARKQTISNEKNK